MNVAFATSPTEGLLESETRTAVSSPPPDSTGTVQSASPLPAAPAGAPAGEPSAQEAAASPARGTRLAISKTGPARAQGGKTGLYRITVRNRGQVAARNVIVADALPAGASLAQEPAELRRARKDLARANSRASLA